MKTIKTFTTYLLLFSVSFCATQINAQIDSTANQDELISPTNMVPPGITAFLSGTSLYLYSAGIGIGGTPGVTLDKQKASLTLFFDPKTTAMRVEFDEKEKKVLTPVIGMGGIGIISKPGKKQTQPPMYFDNIGFVYTGTKKDGYIKVPFEKLSKLMPGQGFLSGVTGVPGIGYPDGSITYYGMDVSPKKFPVLEWVFVYKTEVFEGNDQFTKETLDCVAGQNCIKYKLTSGEDAGSYVLFDYQKRLREISTNSDGYIIFTYEKVTVKLPEAKDMSAYF